MKNLKKIIASTLVLISIIGCTPTMQISANSEQSLFAVVAVGDEKYDVETNKIAFVVEDKTVSDDAQVYVYNFENRKIYLDNNADLSTFDRVFNVSEDNIPVIRTTVDDDISAISYTRFLDITYDYEYHQWIYSAQVSSDVTSNDKSTVGESSSNSNTEFTIGDSTFPRGDINLDGKVNTVDLLMLKKYLLGLMEW